MVITDLHGNGGVWQRLRDEFLRAHEAGEVQRLIMCGDLIHSNSPDFDDSLSMVLDVMRLQADLGPDTIVMLCGNHEMPHIYGMTLARGDHEYTPPFEAALVQLDQDDSIPQSRADVIDFLASLPFYAFTAAGVLIAHAGPARKINTPKVAEKLLNLDHHAFIESIDEELARYDLEHARNLYATRAGDEYDNIVKHQLAVESEDDPRYNHLLRSFVYSTREEFQLMWEALFTRNELEFPNDMRRVVAYSESILNFLDAMSAHSPAYRQRMIVSGHIVIENGGHDLVDMFHMRLATHEHARPQSAGEYLLLDCAADIRNANDLVPMLRPIPTREGD